MLQILLLQRFFSLSADGGEVTPHTDTAYEASGRPAARQQDKYGGQESHRAI
jgi:hypothetical protein